jgi:hypothetical protein
MQQRLGSASGAATAVRLLQSGLADTTTAQYGRLFQHFADYCELEGLSALPATTGTVVSYVGHLAEQGRWAADSMQPIFSAINDAHASLEMELPARGSFFLTRVRRGLGRAQAALSTTDTRTPLPAEAVLDIIKDGESAPLSAVPRVREDAAIALTSLFAGRQDTSVHLRSCDVRVSASEIWLRLSEKGKRHRRFRRVVRLPLAQTSAAGVPSAVPRVAALLQHYFALRERQPGEEPEFAFQLHGESRPTTSTMEGWLASALRRCGVAAPAGFAYQGHSLRSLGVSAMAAIGVPRHVYVWVGGWARGSSVVDEAYVDPTFTPSAAAYALYGWALTRQYASESAVPFVATALPDPREPPSPTPAEPAHMAAARAIARIAAARTARA